MNKSLEILRKLRPEGGWILTGDDFDGIQWVSCKPILKKDFQNELATIEDFVNSKIEIEAKAKAAARQAIADRLGLTADELQVLLG